MGEVRLAEAGARFGCRAPKGRARARRRGRGQRHAAGPYPEAARWNRLPNRPRSRRSGRLAPGAGRPRRADARGAPDGRPAGSGTLLRLRSTRAGGDAWSAGCPEEGRDRRGRTTAEGTRCGQRARQRAASGCAAVPVRNRLTPDVCMRSTRSRSKVRVAGKSRNKTRQTRNPRGMGEPKVTREHAAAIYVYL